MSPIGIVSGSGIDLTPLIDKVSDKHSFDDLINYPSSSIEGHSHCFIKGTCGNIPVVLQCGRLHFYEGLTYLQIVQTVDVMHQFGVEKIIFTNAAGGLLPQMEPGNLVAINQLSLWPYLHWNNRPDTLQTDFTVPGCDMSSTYAWMHGPCYETRSEIAALQIQGSGVVGMSTAPELDRCRELGINSAVISCITNSCCRPQILTHHHVVETAGKASGKLVKIIRDFLEHNPALLQKRPK